MEGIRQHHLVCENTVELVAVERNHLLQALEFVILERSPNEDRRLLRYLLLGPMQDRIVVDLPERRPSARQTSCVRSPQDRVTQHHVCRRSAPK